MQSSEFSSQQKSLEGITTLETSPVGPATCDQQSSFLLQAKPQIPPDPKIYRKLEISTEERMQRLLGELRACFDERAEIRKHTLRTYDSRVENW